MGKQRMKSQSDLHKWSLAKQDNNSYLGHCLTIAPGFLPAFCTVMAFWVCTKPCLLTPRLFSWVSQSLVHVGSPILLKTRSDDVLPFLCKWVQVVSFKWKEAAGDYQTLCICHPSWPERCWILRFMSVTGKLSVTMQNWPGDRHLSSEFCR